MGGQTGPGGKGKGKKKRGNAGVGVDFKKVKHKVGRKLPKAQNETDTSFKARSINLPSQAVKEDKDNLATNYQNLTLKELLGQTSHYSDKVRKHALSGMSDLFRRHPQELSSHVGAVFGRLAERMTDTESSVRTALQGLLRESVCPLVSAAALRPFMPMVMAHVSGATTHLSLDVRNDALVYLDILMDFYPSLVVQCSLLPCLSHFCHLLSSGHRSRSIRGQSLKALLKVLQALCNFLKRAFPKTKASSTSVSLQTKITACRFHTLMHHRCDAPGRTPNTAHTTEATKLASDIGSPAASTPASKGSTPQQAPTSGSQHAFTSVEAAGQQLLLLLMECWPECSPSQLSVSPETDQATALVLILNACDLILDNVVTSLGSETQHVKPGIAAKTRDLIVNSITPCFPARLPAVKPTSTVLELMVQYNLECAQLLVKLLPLYMTPTNHSTIHTSSNAVPMEGVVMYGSGIETGTEAAVPHWFRTLSRYCEGVLCKGEVVPAGDVLSGTAPIADGKVAVKSPKAASSHILKSKGPTATNSLATNAVYQSVLKGVGDILKIGNNIHTEGLLSAMETLVSGLSSKSSLMAICLQLQYRLMTSWQQGSIQLGVQHVASWLAALPKQLWELGDSNPYISGIALRMLHDAARFSNHPTTHQMFPQQNSTAAQGTSSSAAAELAKTLKALQPQLVPLFCVAVPASKTLSSSSKKKQNNDGNGSVAVNEKIHPGPLTLLPKEQQILAIDLLYHLGDIDNVLIACILRAIRFQLFPMDVSYRCVDILMRLATHIDPTRAVSLVLSMLFTQQPDAAALRLLQAKQTEAAGTKPQKAEESMVVDDEQITDNANKQATTAVAQITQQHNPDQQAAVLWFARHYQLCNLVLQLAPSVCPSSVLIQLLSQPLQPLLQATLKQDVWNVMSLSSLHTAVLHAYHILQLSIGALQEVSSACTDAIPLPAWLESSLPELLVWYCNGYQQMASYTSLQAVQNQVGLQTFGTSTQATSSFNMEHHTPSSIAKLLCLATAGQLTLPILQQLVRSKQQCTEAATEQQIQCAQKHYAGLLMVCRSLLNDASVKKLLLQTEASLVKDAVESLLSHQGLPGQITAHLECSAMTQQLKHALNDIYGTRT